MAALLLPLRGSTCQKCMCVPLLDTWQLAFVLSRGRGLHAAVGAAAQHIEECTFPPCMHLPLQCTPDRSSRQTAAGSGRVYTKAPAASAMLVQHLPQLVQHRVVLASASPRRQELLILLGLQVGHRIQAADAVCPAAPHLMRPGAAHDPTAVGCVLSSLPPGATKAILSSHAV